MSGSRPHRREAALRAQASWREVLAAESTTPEYVPFYADTVCNFEEFKQQFATDAYFIFREAGYDVSQEIIEHIVGQKLEALENRSTRTYKEWMISDNNAGRSVIRPAAIEICIAAKLPEQYSTDMETILINLNNARILLSQKAYATLDTQSPDLTDATSGSSASTPPLLSTYPSFSLSNLNDLSDFRYEFIARQADIAREAASGSQENPDSTFVGRLLRTPSPEAAQGGSGSFVKRARTEPNPGGVAFRG